METEEFIRLVEDTLEVKPGTLTLDSNLRDLDWDSLSDISFIAAVDEKLSITLDAMELAASETAGDLYVLVTSTLAASK